MDLGPQLPDRLHNDAPFTAHHAMAIRHCRRVAARAGGSNNLESDRAWQVHHGLGLQGAVKRLCEQSADRHHMENVGTTKVQILLVAHRPKHSMDI
jgi:hypothetical protein